MKWRTLEAWESQKGCSADLRLAHNYAKMEVEPAWLDCERLQDYIPPQCSVPNLKSTGMAAAVEGSVSLPKVGMDMEAMPDWTGTGEHIDRYH